MGGMAALSIPRTEYRMRDSGEAAQASAMPWLRFFLTRRARLAAGTGVVSIVSIVRAFYVFATEQT